ncbi:hypothetical protein RJT34_23425 [Clitoria ternatea]|uniref:Uncharacterized protein n=1 Tax=Clitoria ternatea TaxID=43366 RepID=A0AAN9FKZ6_CLITE
MSRVPSFAIARASPSCTSSLIYLFFFLSPSFIYPSDDGSSTLFSSESDSMAALNGASVVLWTPKNGSLVKEERAVRFLRDEERKGKKKVWPHFGMMGMVLGVWKITLLLPRRFASLVVAHLVGFAPLNVVLLCKILSLFSFYLVKINIDML